MPYDTILWGEAQAANGLTGFAGLAGQNHQKDGDKLQLLTSSPPPYLQGLGFLSDTKPQACALVPDEMKAQLPIYGPGGIDFWGDGWLQILRSMPIELIKGDKLTGQGSTTNVDEGGIVAADIVYGNVLPPWDPKDLRTRYAELLTDVITITSAAAVTYNSGEVALKDALSNYSKWADTKGSFEILGVLNLINAATFGGICNVTKLGGAWEGKQPGLIVNPLSAVVFNSGVSFVPALEPIPFEGDGLPSVGMTATSAGAMPFGILIGKLP